MSYNNLKKAIPELRKLMGKQLFVGVQGSQGKMAMIAHVMEYGTHIIPKNGKYLTIPSENVPHGMGARDFKDLHMVTRGNGKGILVDKAGKVMFYLVDRVDIPGRHYFTETYDMHIAEWSKKYRNQVHEILMGRQTADGCMEYMGQIVTRDIRKAIVEWKSPHNAPVTIARKHGVDNPLVDTGRLGASITHEVRRS